MQYALLTDVWGDDALKQHLPLPQVKNIYKSRPYQRQFLTNHQQSCTPTSNIPMPYNYHEECVNYLKNMYDQKGFNSVLSVLPEKFVDKLNITRHTGVTELFSTDINMDTVISWILYGFIALVLVDVFTRMTRR